MPRLAARAWGDVLLLANSSRMVSVMTTPGTARSAAARLSVKLMTHASMGFMPCCACIQAWASTCLAASKPNCRVRKSAPASSFFRAFRYCAPPSSSRYLNGFNAAPSSPVRSVLAGNLQRGHRLQIAHGGPAGIMARQAVPAEQQQLIQATGLHRRHLTQQIRALAVLA